MNLSGDKLKYANIISAGKPVEKDIETYDALHNKLDKPANGQH